MIHHHLKKNTAADPSFAKHNYSPSRTCGWRYNNYKNKAIWREIKINY